jgi:hypothetical protein
MKKIYLLHLLSLILLLFIGYNFLAELIFVLENPIIEEGVVTDLQMMSSRIRAKLLTKVYGVCSLFIFAFSVFVGWITIAKFKNTGRLLILVSISGFVGTVLMLNSSHVIDLERGYPVWLFLVVIVICINIYGLLNYQEAPNLRMGYTDEILDDEMNQ